MYCMLPAGRLCLHTPRADCNEKRPRLSACSMPLPPHAPCRLQLYDAIKAYPGKVFASTRPVQIATYEEIAGGANIDLCLHTPRADCNRDCAGEKSQKARLCLHTPRADCNASPLSSSILRMLCLHTPRADCNSKRQADELVYFCFASTRPVQIATAEMHRIAICTFQNVC